MSPGTWLRFPKSSMSKMPSLFFCSIPIPLNGPTIPPVGQAITWVTSDFSLPSTSGLQGATGCVPTFPYQPALLMVHLDLEPYKSATFSVFCRFSQCSFSPFLHSWSQPLTIKSTIAGVLPWPLRAWIWGTRYFCYYQEFITEPESLLSPSLVLSTTPDA